MLEYRERLVLVEPLGRLGNQDLRVMRVLLEPLGPEDPLELMVPQGPLVLRELKVIKVKLDQLASQAQRGRRVTVEVRDLRVLTARKVLQGLMGPQDLLGPLDHKDQRANKVLLDSRVITDNKALPVDRVNLGPLVNQGQLVLPVNQERQAVRVYPA